MHMSKAVIVVISAHTSQSTSDRACGDVPQSDAATGTGNEKTTEVLVLMEIICRECK